MSNYSALDRIIHEQFLKRGELTRFFINKIISNSSKYNSDESSHIFITGLARSGTTALLQ